MLTANKKVVSGLKCQISKESLRVTLFFIQVNNLYTRCCVGVAKTSHGRCAGGIQLRRGRGVSQHYSATAHLAGIHNACVSITGVLFSY
jgi:hypothetical protein